MEKSEAIRRFNEGKHYIETCLEQIASLEQNNDKELRQVLRGTAMVEVSYKAVENFCKVGSYVFDGKDGAQKLKDKLINMKVKVLQLYDGADRNNLLMIKNICDTIISEINEVEEWTGDNEQTVLRTNLTDNIDIPETGENECVSIGDDSSENKSGESLTPDQIKEKIKKIEPFPKAKTDEPIPFGKYYRILTNGEFTQANGVKKEFQVIDAEKCDLDLFCLCVERADISDIIKENRQIARLFMYYVANKFKDSGEYVKAAQKALGLNARLSAVPLNYRADFYNLLGDEFPDSNPNKY